MRKIITLKTALNYDERKFVENNCLTKLQLTDQPSDSESDSHKPKLNLKDVANLPEHEREAIKVFSKDIRKVDRKTMTRSFVSSRSKHIDSSRHLSLSDILMSDEEGGFPNATANLKNTHQSQFELRHFALEKELGSPISTLKPDLDKTVDVKMNALKTHTRQLSFSMTDLQQFPFEVG